MAGMKSIDAEHAAFVWDQLRSRDEYASLTEEIETLEQLVQSGANNRTLKGALNAVGKGYVTRRMWCRTNTTFRARPADKLWSHVRDLVAPPAAVASAGRFNEARRPVRYFAGDPHTALMEVRAETGGQYVLLVAKLRPGIKSPLFVQLGIDKLPRSPSYEHGDLEGVLKGLAAEPWLEGYLERLGIRDFWLRQDTYFNEMATKFYDQADASDIYRLTWLLGQQLMKVKDVSGIFYPTVQNNYNGANTAMPELLAKAALAPWQAWLVQIWGQVAPVGPGHSLRHYEGGVIRRGPINSAGVVEWGDYGYWDINDLHWQVAPLLPIPPALRAAAAR